jgi:hypothetical protein
VWGWGSRSLGGCRRGEERPAGGELGFARRDEEDRNRRRSRQGS